MRMLGKRSKRLNGAFLRRGCVMTAEAWWAMLESNRSEVMFSDAPEWGQMAYFFVCEKLAGISELFREGAEG